MSHDRFCVLIVCLAGAVAGVTGAPRQLPATDQPSARNAAVQERLNRVRADLVSRADRASEAIPELKAILAIDPGSAEAHLLLALAYRNLGGQEFLAEAVAELRQALASDPDLLPARVYLAQAYLDLGRPERAREELNAALVQSPGHPQVLAVLGNVERHLKNPRRSLEVLRQALQADSSFVQARYYLGLALLDLGQRDEAIQELEWVVRAGATSADVSLSLGSAYIEAGRFAAAVEILRQAIQQEPSRPDLRIQLARAYRSSGSLAKSEEQLKIATPGRASTLFGVQDVEVDLYLEQGLLRQQQGRLPAAVEAFKRVLDRDPDHGPANCHLAEVYLRQGLHTLSSRHAARAETLGFPLPEASRKLLEEKLHHKNPGR